VSATGRWQSTTRRRTIGFPAICGQFNRSLKGRSSSVITSLAVNHFSPACFAGSDLTGSEKTALAISVGGAIADDRHLPSPRIRILKAIVVELEPPHTALVTHDLKPMLQGTQPPAPCSDLP
jgi:hypothetical protein